MMIKSSSFLRWFLWVCLLAIACPVYASDVSSHKDVVPWLPEEIKPLVDKTFSVWPAERAEAVYRLGELGAEAEKAIPFIMRLLHDQFPVWCSYNGNGMWTTPGQEAARAMIKLTPYSKDLVDTLLSGKHPYIRMTPDSEKNFIYAFSIAADRDFGSLSECVDWWKTTEEPLDAEI